jgi:hypothetical protein
MTTINDNRRARGLHPIPGGDVPVEGGQYEHPAQTRDGGGCKWPKDPEGTPHPDAPR